MFLIRFKYDDRQGTIGTCRSDYYVDKGTTLYAQHGRAVVTHCHHATPVRTKMILCGSGIVTVRA